MGPKMPRTTERAGQRPDPTEQLRGVVRLHHPVTSVVLCAPRDDEPHQELSLRWSALRRRLADEGAPQDDLAVVDAALPSLPRGDHALAVFAARGQEALRLILDRYDGADEGTFSPWPHAMPLLRWSSQRLPTLLITVSHGGAEVSAYDHAGTMVLSEVILGDNDEIERNNPGGWAQARYRRRAEDSWRRNAKQFVAYVERTVEAVRAEQLLVAGDPHEVSLVLDHLPEALRAITSNEAHSSGGGVGMVKVPRLVVDERARSAAGVARRAALTAFDAAAARGQAVEGADDVRRAFYSGAVEQLVVVDGRTPADDADAFIAAALDTDATILVAQPADIDLVNGIGARLRFPSKVSG